MNYGTNQYIVDSNNLASVRQNVSQSTFFGKLFQTRFPMMCQMLLPYLTLKEILHLSLVSKQMNKLMDPVRNQMANETSVSIHLKRIAAVHLLPHGDQLTLDEIDSAFGYDVRRMADFSKILKGQKLKQMFQQKMAQTPDLLRFGKQEDGNTERILNTWQAAHEGCVFDTSANLQNPLSSVLDALNVSYKYGGVFEIKRVQFDEQSNMFMDYYILIESIKDCEQYQLLRKLHNQSQEETMAVNRSTDQLQVTDDDQEIKCNSSELSRATIANHLQGIGRIVQYFMKPGQQQSINQRRIIYSVYEGEIKNGIAHGFARIIYGSTGKSYTGYYLNGVKTGKGIQKNPDGTVQAQGYWTKNEWIQKAEVITSFYDQFDDNASESDFEIRKIDDETPTPNKMIYVPQDDTEQRLQLEILRVTLENQLFLQEMRTYLQENDIDIDEVGVEN